MPLLWLDDATEHMILNLIEGATRFTIVTCHYPLLLMEIARDSVEN